MIRLDNIHKSFGGDIIFNGISIHMSKSERLGLIGRNGSGKTTLFKLITSEVSSDDGNIYIPKNYNIGYLEQHLDFNEPTVLKTGCQGLPKDEIYNEYKVEKILFGLGFTNDDLNKSPKELSGGFQVRLSLARTLISNPSLLLLDEPTNYLDIVSIRWVTKFLKSWENELIIISHDRDFIDEVTTHTAMLHRKKIYKVHGNTSKLISLIEQTEETYEKTRINEERERKQMEDFVNKYKAKAAIVPSVRSRIKKLQKTQVRTQLEKIDDLEFRFRYHPFAGRHMMEIHNLSFHFNNKIPLIKNLTFQIKGNDRIGVIGKNGKGKSTLLRLMAEELAPVHGTVKANINAQTAFFGQTNILRLNKNLTVEEEISNSNPNLGKGSVMSICGIMMFGGDKAKKKVSVLSGGEKSRVLLGKIVASPANLILLDEPSNHLDLQSIESMVDSINEFKGAVVIVTHDEMILRAVATKLLVFQRGNVELFHGGYDDFLSRVGWEDEENDKPKENTIKVNKKDLRKQRSQIIQEKSKILKPLKQKIDDLENKIHKLEKELHSANETLKHATENQNIDDLVKISREIQDTQESIDELFLQLEKTSKEYDQKAKEYEDRLEL